MHGKVDSAKKWSFYGVSKRRPSYIPLVERSPIVAQKVAKELPEEATHIKCIACKIFAKPRGQYETNLLETCIT